MQLPEKKKKRKKDRKKEIKKERKKEREKKEKQKRGKKTTNIFAVTRQKASLRREKGRWKV